MLFTAIKILASMVAVGALSLGGIFCFSMIKVALSEIWGV